jgi:tetratricopeptide (TPR) repeat protein
VRIQFPPGGTELSAESDMALGFGFNKAKVLASAEKYVQQGKLQNAIGEYEKVSKEDPKDLTVLNTIGDLYARLGQVDKATASFRKVGDHYAADGFTVKAIAMYKKLTKVNPGAVDAVQRLAEFYTQQGLYNDARQQYVAVAEHWLKNNDQAAAASIFNKMLELDPDNAAVQSKLADLYIKLGKKEDAKEIFFRAADSLHMRGALDAADEALNKILNLDPVNPRALMKRAQLAMDQGDGATAVRLLSQVSNLDGNPDGLALLLRAHLMTGESQAAETVARTLAGAHKDFSGISVLGEWMFNNGALDHGLALLKEFSSQVGDDSLLRVLEPVLTRERENPAALESMLSIYQEAGSKAHILECTELLANAQAAAGNLPRARDLFAELVKLEPENTGHEQLYRQVLTKLGQDPSVRPLSAQQGSKPFVPEELAPPSSRPSEMDVSSEWETAFEAPVATGPSAAHEAIEEIKFYISQGMWSEAKAGLERAESADPNHPELAEIKAQVAAALGGPAPAEFGIAVEPPAAVPPAQEFSFESATAGTPAEAPLPAPDFSIEVTPPAAEPAPVEAVAAAAPAPPDQFSDFLSDLDSALPQDFHAPAPKAKAVAAAAPVSAPPPVVAPPPVAAVPPSAPAPPRTEEETLLDDMFQEFKDEAEQSGTEAEDPETHYNLGVAFREMGLMDEAIGELQKVCTAIDRGTSFRDGIQAYSWLAQCFVDKGVPEASYKWYEKALKLASEEDQRNALHYDLAGAYELAGNKQAALQHFMEVYGSNIDYRDVAERIKALRA